MGFSKLKKGNIIESVFDNIEEKAKYNDVPLKKKHRAIIGMKRRMQYYKKLQNEFGEILKKDIPNTVIDDSETMKVWFLWIQGIENAPVAVKACYNSVERVCVKLGWELICLSGDNIYEYISLPELIVEKYKKGIISIPHFSDMVRLDILSKYGGIWTDSTVFWSDDKIFPMIEKADLFLPNKWLFFSGEIMKYDNWFIRAKKGNGVIKALQECLYAYWEKYDFPIDYFIFHLFLTLILTNNPEIERKIPYLSVHSCEYLQTLFFQPYNENMMEFILKQTDIHKFNYKNIPNEEQMKGTFFERILLDSGIES